MPGQEEAVEREHRHVVGGTGLGADRRQPAQLLGGDGDGALGARELADCGWRVVRERAGGRGPREGLAPVGEIRLLGLGEPVALPVRVVGVLDVQVRELGGVGGVVRLVEGPEFAFEDGQGPFVEDDVVGGEEEEVLVGCGLPEVGAQEWAGGEVEGLGGGLAGEVVGLFGCGGCCGEGGVPGGLDGLGDGAVGFLEGGAEGFVALDEGVDGGVESGEVERAGELVVPGDVVGGAVGGQAPEEPHAFLGVRGGGRGAGLAGVVGDVTGSGAVFVDPAGLAGDGGCGERLVEGEFDVEFGAEFEDQAGGEQGVPAEGEEVVVDADFGQSQDRAPDGGDAAFGLGAGCGAALAGEPAAGVVRDVQGLAVQLAVGGQRERVDEEQQGRHRRLRQ